MRKNTGDNHEAEATTNGDLRDDGLWGSHPLLENAFGVREKTRKSTVVVEIKRGQAFDALQDG